MSFILFRVYSYPDSTQAIVLEKSSIQWSGLQAAKQCRLYLLIVLLEWRDLRLQRVIRCFFALWKGVQAMFAVFFGLLQVLRIQSFQFRNNKLSIFADESVVKPDFSAAVFRTLD